MSRHHRLKRYRHVELHRLFFNLNLDQIIELLVRVKRAKERQRRR